MLCVASASAEYQLLIAYVGRYCYCGCFDVLCMVVDVARWDVATIVSILVLSVTAYYIHRNAIISSMACCSVLGVVMFLFHVFLWFDTVDITIPW